MFTKVFLSFGILAASLASTPVLAAETEKVFSEERCEERQADLAVRLTEIADRHAVIQAHEDEASLRLETLADEADAAGFDSTALRADLASFEAQADVLENDYLSWVSALEAVQAMDCSTATLEDAQALRSTARTAHIQLREDAEAMRTLMRDTIRPDARALHEQLNDSTDSE